MNFTSTVSAAMTMYQPIHKRDKDLGPKCASATEAMLWIWKQTEPMDWAWQPVAEEASIPEKSEDGDEMEEGKSC